MMERKDSDKARFCVWWHTMLVSLSFGLFFGAFGIGAGMTLRYGRHIPHHHSDWPGVLGFLLVWGGFTILVGAGWTAWKHSPD